MTAACTFSVEGVNGAPFKGCHGVFHKTRFVQGVCVNGNLCVGFFRHVQTVVDGGWCGSPVFVKLQANGACIDLFMQ